MSENPADTIRLINLVDFNTTPLGGELGGVVFRRLSGYLKRRPKQAVFVISLKGVVATDSVFARESVVAAALHHRRERGLFLVDFASRDLVDNWNYAARAKNQPLPIQHDGEIEFIGPAPRGTHQRIVDLVYGRRFLTAPAVARALGITIQNASTNLKNLYDRGYILRTRESAPSGGDEFTYSAIAQDHPDQTARVGS